VDLDAERIAAMDDTGLDVSVISMTTPGLQNLEPSDAMALQGVCNDRLADAIRRHPDRLQGFATLATPTPAAAAAELDRAVRELGFNGAMLYGRTRERNLDHRDFWPIFEASEALNAPLYLHPQPPPPAVRAAYYSGLGDDVDTALATHGYGWHYDAGLQLLRLILGGVLDRFPGLQLILGHWGEVMMFYLDRIDRMAGIADLARPVSDYVRTNVFVTPGGVFSQRYLQWSLDVVGVDRILFASDYPYVMVPDGGSRRFLEQADISETDREKIASGNWEKLCAGIRR
jgi:predicted TIM-barrel fold metal-dependent hydrolase